jgi:hypothetical protein
MTGAVGLNWGNEAARFAEIRTGADFIKTRRFIPPEPLTRPVILSVSEGSPEPCSNWLSILNYIFVNQLRTNVVI